LHQLSRIVKPRWAVFGGAEKARNDGKEREIAALEVDGTMVHSQKKGEGDFEAKLGLN